MANETMLEKPSVPARDVMEAANGNGYAGGSDVALPGSAAERLADSIGAFKDDPTFDEMMRIIRERRREMDADDSIP